MGHRAGTVVPLSTLKLKTLLSGSAARSRGAADPGLQNEIITGALNFDREAVLTCLNKASAELGVKFFLGERIAPLVVEIGCAWAEGRLDIRHEHFLSEILEDTLRGLRAPLEVGARGRPVLLATLPNELHSLGLQMAALTCVMAGRRVRLLGTQTPVEEILAAVDRLDPAAVGLSVTGSSALSETAGTINRLGAHLPESVRLWIGGAGAQELKDLDPSVVALKDLEAMENEIASLPA
jgi:methanogenic corrinoid protein MtbC1